MLSSSFLTAHPTYRPSLLQTLKARIRLEEDNYPEIAGRIFLLNTPTLFLSVWSVVKL
jgi:hypothetical protein